MTGCRAVLQELSDDASVAVVNDALLQHIETSVPRFCFIVNSDVQTSCLYNMRWACR